MVVLLTLFVMIIPHEVLAASKAQYIKEGNALYQKEQFDQALDHYTEALKSASESDIINFDLGTALYKKGDYPATINHLNKSLLTEDKGLKQKAHYNLGNAFYRTGQSQEKKDLSSAVSSLTQSLAHFEQAIQLDDKDEDAKFNYEFVKKELEQLKKKQNENPQQQSRSSPQSDQQKKQDQSNQQNQNQPTSSYHQKSDSDKDQQQQTAQNEQNQEGEQNPNMPQTQGQTDNSDKEQGGDKEDQSLGSQSKQDNPTPQELSKQEAEMLINSFKQNEEPKGLLNLQGRRIEERPVVKDW